MTLNAGAMATWSKGRKTATAATKINQLIQPRSNKKTKLTSFESTVGATAHTLTVLRPLNTTTVSAVVAAGSSTVILTADPGVYTNKRTANNVIAANDFLVFEVPDGTFYFDTVSAVTVNADGTATLTMTTAVPTLGLKAGAKVWFMGVAADTDPNTAEAHPVFTLAASGVVNQESPNGLAESIHDYEPLLIQVDNATNASVLEYLSGCYGP